MAITDIQISEELETNAPSIKYRGNEGPKSPQEMEQMMVAQLEEEYAKYVFEMQEQGLEPMSLQRFIQQAIAEGQMSGGQPLPNDPTKPVNPWTPKPQGPALPNRQMAGFGTDKEVIWEMRRDSLSFEMFNKDYEDLNDDEKETIEIQLDM